MDSKGAGKVWDHQNEALPVRAITILPLFPLTALQCPWVLSVMALPEHREGWVPPLGQMLLGIARQENGLERGADTASRF